MASDYEQFKAAQKAHRPPPNHSPLLFAIALRILGTITGIFAIGTLATMDDTRDENLLTAFGLAFTSLILWCFASALSAISRIEQRIANLPPD